MLPYYTSRPETLIVAINRGVLGYEYLNWKSKAGTSYLIIRFSLTFDEEKIWESSSSFGSTPVYQPANSNWYWWISPCSFSNCRRAYEDVTNMKLGTNKLSMKYYFSTLLKNSNGSLRWFSGRSDILHIPGKQIRAFSIRDLLQANSFHRNCYSNHDSVKLLLRRLSTRKSPPD